MRKRVKQAISLLLAAALLTLSACQETAAKAPVETWTFTDSCGREVEVPVEVNTVVPAGPPAQMILYTFCPDKLQSLCTALTRTQKLYMDEKYYDLPVTGRVYGTGGTVNYEEIISAVPDLIIDMGEEKEDIRGDMDEVQLRTGVPVVFVESGLDGLADAYETLGKLVGEEERGAQCAAYIRNTLTQTQEYAAQIPEGERRRVLYAQGEYGTEVMGVGSLHAEVIDWAGGINVAELDSAVASEGGNEVSMEQILLWDPEVVILAPDSNYDEIFRDPAWAGVTAVKNGAVYEAPYGPYNWMDRPPSVQRVLAIQWLGSLLYPEVFDYDMIAEAQNFYSLFFHYDLTGEEARDLMGNSAFRED